MTEFGKLDMGEDGIVTYQKIGDVNQSDMLRCPFFLMEFVHYREDGSCRCNDRDEQDRLIREYDYTPGDFIERGLRD